MGRKADLYVFSRGDEAVWSGTSPPPGGHDSMGCGLASRGKYSPGYV